MNTLFSYLEGKKTYIVVVLGLITVVLHRLGYMTDDLYNTLLTLEGLTGAATIRVGMKK